ncbi:hypothetical protein LshimejAT787_0904450 [Lyophyllum shimeji]|uniref:Uncharacterized protein n=1 Tax=Lyophyllum shimeji TaxID=47721 RepID=A0A9P3URE1_LYOSH|nr:hypothetical protein LshimejAT787_0904450 [Lyophyllum shimeji]
MPNQSTYNCRRPFASCPYPKRDLTTPLVSSASARDSITGHPAKSSYRYEILYLPKRLRERPPTVVSSFRPLR